MRLGLFLWFGFHGFVESETLFSVLGVFGVVVW